MTAMEINDKIKELLQRRYVIDEMVEGLKKERQELIDARTELIGSGANAMVDVYSDENDQLLMRDGA